MHVEGEAILAQCYLKKEGDIHNVCYLSRQTLFIRHKKKLHPFPLTSIEEIYFDHKLILFPLVLGGIIAPLSLHALINELFNPWFLLSTMLLGLLMMYYGWEGSSTLTIKTRIKEYDIFVSAISPNLKEFAQYIRQYLKDETVFNRFYIVIDKDQWDKVKNSHTLLIDKPIRLYHHQEIVTASLQKHEVLLNIDPIENNIQITFQTTSDSQKAVPLLLHDLPVEYIHEGIKQK